MRVFLASPFTSYLISAADAPDSLTLDPVFARFLMRVDRSLQQSGHEVFCAQRTEEFGAALRAEHICTPLDMLELQRSDCIVAFPQRSFGVHIELGWASAIGTRIILIASASDLRSPLLKGLHTVAECDLISVSDDLLQNEQEQLDLLVRLDAALAAGSPRAPRRRRAAFLATSFGYGPASKAATIAKALRAAAPDIECDLMGAGLDYAFARNAGAFDRVYRLDVDDRAILSQLMPLLAGYSFVVSVLNTEILTMWNGRPTPLYFVDSLAWMWPEPPAGVERVSRYFVQDYLVPQDRAAAWSAALPIDVVGPIVDVRLPRAVTAHDGVSLLLVNFSGCGNPHAPADLFETYVGVLARIITERALPLFERIVFACSSRLHGAIRAAVGTPDAVTVAELNHDAFIGLLARADMFITSPGITATLEARALGKAPRFLLPQNYSQMLISERYADLHGLRDCMPFSRFGAEYGVPEGLPETEGLRLVNERLASILSTGQESLDAFVAELLTSDGVPAQHSTNGPLGQDAIAARIFADMEGVA